MASRLFCTKLKATDLSCINLTCLRFGHTMRGKPPGVARSLQQRLEELNYKDPELSYKVDIGFPQPKRSRSEELSQRLAHVKSKRNDPTLEKLARTGQLQVDLLQVKADWLETSGPYQIKKIAEHYGVFEHLFGDAYFIPRILLSIDFKQDNGELTPVHFGNTVKPFEAKDPPKVHYKAENNSLYSLILTNPDGHLTKENSEYVHWFIGNIPGNDITRGDLIAPYLQPIPPRGTGYHRHIFILYKQDKKIDYSNLKINDSMDLKKRTFSTLDFYRERQDVLTPAGLSFFQSDWDKTLTDFYHKSLNMKEPVFEYDFPQAYIKPQEWFPLREPFNLYMDKYRDPKQINKEYLIRKLKETHPFKPPAEKLKFPNAHSFDKKTPSWLKLELKKQRLGWGRVNDV